MVAMAVLRAEHHALLSSATTVPQMGRWPWCCLSDGELIVPRLFVSLQRQARRRARGMAAVCDNRTH